jgi:hypothetical protein
MTTTEQIHTGDKVTFTSERTGRTEYGTVQYVLPTSTNVRFDDDTYTTVPNRCLKVVR